MTTNAERYVEQLIQSELENTSVGTNANIYDQKLTHPYPSAAYTEVPCAVYFYYIVFETDHKLRVDHFLYADGPRDGPGHGLPIPPDKIDGVVEYLAANARSTGTKNPPVNGNNFAGIIWRHKSYIVILLDEDDWVFLRQSNEQVAAAFNVSKGSTANHSFFDARDLTVTVPKPGGGTETRSAILFINHMKRNSNGVDLGNESQLFYFDAYVNVSYSGMPAGTLRVILDPGGTNQGPPTPPP